MTLCTSRTRGTSSAAACARSRTSASSGPVGSTWTTTSASGSADCTARSTASAAACPWLTAAPYVDADHDVGEVAPRRLPHAQPSQLHGRLYADDRLARRLLGVRGSAVHQDVDVAAHQPRGREQDEGGDEERRDRVRPRVARSHEEQTDEHRERAGEVTAEVHGVRRERRARIGARHSPRGRRPGEVDADDHADYEKRVPGCVDRRATVDEPHDCAPGDEDAGDDEDRALGERREVLGLAVPVLVSRIGGPHGDADGEEREQSSDEIRSRIGRRRDEGEAVGRETGAELQRDERDRCGHRPERGFPRGFHGPKRTQRLGQAQDAMGSSGQISASWRNAKWQLCGAPPSVKGTIEASSTSASAGLRSQRSWCISALASAEKSR